MTVQVAGREVSRKFSRDPSLVLYLPLYKLDGASFASRDAYGHLCTVTGALWRPNGHYFDGNDDIQKTSINLCPAYPFTLSGWFNLSAWGHIFSIGDTAVANKYHAIRVNAANVATLTTRNTTEYNASGTTNMLNKWHRIDGVFASATERKLYVDAELIATGTDSSDNFTGTAFAVGTLIRSNLSQYATGTIGEVLARTRGLSQPEIEREFVATKWRYQ